jgi:non-specific serine/threonine protein kinase
MRPTCSDFNGKLDNHYILESELASGASYKVYKTKDCLSSEIYAAKVFNKYHFEIENEIKFSSLVTQYKNPSFQKYITSSEGLIEYNEDKDKKYKYIIFELCSKGDLYDYIKCTESGLRESNCKILFYKILKAIQVLHQMGISHNNIKAQNILLDGENFDIKISNLRVSSFSKNVNGKTILKTKRVGSNVYMSPEIILGHSYDGEKADIFSLGVLLFFIMNFSPPFPIAKVIKNTNSSQRLYSFIKEKKNINLYWNYMEKYVITKKLTNEFKNLFIKMVSYNPKERPTIEQILNDDWLKDIQNLEEEVFKKYEQELVSELKEREEIINLSI